MNPMTQRSISYLRSLMIGLNMIIVIFYGSVILLSTRYIINHELARDFLNTLDYIPHHPLLIFFGSILLYSLLVFMMVKRIKWIQDHETYNMIYSLIEIVLCFGIIYMLNMSYNGIILLVLGDCIYYLKRNKYMKWIIALLVFIFLISNYDVFSNFIPMTNINRYIDVYDASLKGLLNIAQNTLSAFNILLFIAFMISYIANQIQENENITKELNMIHQVNEELKNYASITEKIGESNERKRLAREIHDTLGHALTGIAAGIDACIATIDINPSATKDQLFVISKVVRQGIGDVRNSLNKLRPGALEEHGLKGALDKMINEFSQVSDLTITLNYALDKVDFENTKEDIIFRVIQESITNAMRHGGAKNIQVDLYLKEDVLYIHIQDDGIGCEDIHYGYGLKQMQERLMMINGTVEYDGSHGFKTVVKIPMQRGEQYD